MSSTGLDGTPREPSPAPPATDEAGPAPMDVEESRQQEPDLQSPALPTVPVSLAPITIGIDFALVNPRTGLHFALPDAAHFPHRWPHAHSSNLRDIMPCLDSLRDKGTWDLEFVVPRDLTRFDGSETETRQTAVVCSGDLVERVCYPDDPRKAIFRYKLDVPTATRSVAFSVGPFEVYRLERWHGPGAAMPDYGSSDMSDPLDGGGCVVYVLPGRLRDAKANCSFLSEALEFFVNEYLTSSFPFSSFKLVAVDNIYVPIKVGATIAIFGSHLLVPEGAIEQVYETRRLLSQALAQQWFGHYLTPRAWNDVWLCIALSVFVADLFLATHFGQAEVKSRMKMAVDRLVQLDVHELPLCPAARYDKEFVGILGSDVPQHERVQRTDPLEVFHNDYESTSTRSTLLELKGGIVMYMLDRRLGKGALQKALAHLLLERTSGEMPEGLATQHFLKQCKSTEATSSDVKDFASQWIFGSGMPSMQFRFELNRRKQVVEVQMIQLNRSFLAKNPAATRIFSGPFSIRVHEPAGTFDTDIQVDDTEQNFELQYHSRTRKVQRIVGTGVANKPSDPEPRPATPAQPADPDQDPEESGGIEEDFDWIRVDPDNDWLCVKECVQNSIMWDAQLLKDRDLAAQLEAVRQLSSFDAPFAVDSLISAVKNTSLFHAVRVDAGRSLAAIASTKSPNSRRAFELLIATYRELFCLNDPEMEGSCNLPKESEVLDLSAYFVQKGLLSAIASARIEGADLQTDRYRLLLDQVRCKDRSLNSFDDSCLVASLLCEVAAVMINPADATPSEQNDSLRNVQTSFENIGEDMDDAYLRDTFARSAAAARWRKVIKEDDLGFYAELMDEIRQLQGLDQALPTYQNVLSIAILRVALFGMLAGIYPMDLYPFLRMSRCGNFLELRLAALDALIVLGGLSITSISDYILLVVARDPVPYVRFHVARSLAYFAVYLTRSADPEGDAAAAALVLDLGDSNASVLAGLLSRVPRSETNAVRERMQYDSRMRSSVWAVLNDQGPFDVRIRHFLLLFCELVFEPNPASVAFAAVHQYKPLVPEGGWKRADSHSRHLRDSSPAIPPEPIFLEKALEMMATLRDTPWSEGFVYPVAERYPQLADHYLAMIKHPMDLYTVEAKLRDGRYLNDPKKLDNDVQLIFKNCYQFNQDSIGVYKSGQQLERIYLRTALPSFYTALGLELPPAVAAAKERLDLEAANSTMLDEGTVMDPGAAASAQSPLFELFKRCRTIVNQLTKKSAAKLFRQPVDPVKENLPAYFQYIKNPMDLGTVRKNLDTGVYPSIEAFVGDVRLVFANAYLFNGRESIVGKDAGLLERTFDGLLLQYGLQMYADVGPSANVAMPIPAAGQGEASAADAMAIDQDVQYIEPAAGALPAALTERADLSAGGPSVGPPAEARKEPSMEPPAVEERGVGVQPEELRLQAQEPHLPPAGSHEVAVISPTGIAVESAGAFVPVTEPVATTIPAPSAPVQDWQTLPAGQDLIQPAPAMMLPPVTVPEVAPLPVTTEPHALQAPHPPQPTAPPKVIKAVLAPPKVYTPREAMDEVLRLLESSDSSVFFRFLVKPEDLPDYYTKIMKPIALANMREKLDAGQYASPIEFDYDFRLLMHNAMIYNGPRTKGHTDATTLKKLYAAQMKKFKIEVNATDKPPIVVPPPQPPQPPAQGPSDPGSQQPGAAGGAEPPKLLLKLKFGGNKT